MSVCRQNFNDEVEKQLNIQVNLEFKAAHIYTIMSAHFGKDSVSLPGFKKFFNDNAFEERTHAQQFIDYILLRGGMIDLFTIEKPDYESWSPLEAVTKALILEKMVNHNLLELHKLADKYNDPHLCDFLEEHFLDEQVESIRKLSDMITNINRVGDGLGIYLFDKSLQ